MVQEIPSRNPHPDGITLSRWPTVRVGPTYLPTWLIAYRLFGMPPGRFVAGGAGNVKLFVKPTVVHLTADDKNSHTQSRLKALPPWRSDGEIPSCEQRPNLRG